MMRTAGRKHVRNGRAVTLAMAPGWIGRAWQAVLQPAIFIRLGLALAAVTALSVVSQAWAPPCSFRVGFVPDRNIVARVGFEIPDPRDLGMETRRHISYGPGDRLVKAGQPLAQEAMSVLLAEHEAYIAALPTSRKVERSLAVCGMILGVLALCGLHAFHRDRRILVDLRRFATLLAMVVVTVLLSRWASADPLRAELVPMLLFGMTVGIAYGRDIAMSFSLAVAVIMQLACGRNMADLVLITGTVAAAVVQLGQIRSRRKLIVVGFRVGCVAPLLTLLVGSLSNQPWGVPLFSIAAYNGVWSVVTGFLITGLLPFIEEWFGVLTELSLLELGDVAHPLLQELVRRAPGTYNHSINVASIAEAAAESIGARGLLVRVGAYFHDIGKMLKPDYFVENQGLEASRHDTLVPAMSTLIIIAHVKDGASLARQHHLPEPIIDFILQHHGTTLVEYFYRRAHEQREGKPDADDVEESSFRYPGPKPQTVEAAVLMLADAVESASRVLVEPTPARLESLVEDLSMKRLLDGQFDDCGLTLKQLRTVEDSLIKSLTAVYHGRIKYPDQRTA